MIRVAAAQFFSGDDPVANADLCRQWIERASEAGADLVVLPEGANRVRDFATREACFDGVEAIDGPFVAALQDAARTFNIHVAAGIDLRGDEAPDAYIELVMIDPSGAIIGRHRKHFLWDYEYTLYRPGVDDMPVIETDLGRIGMIICADGLIPEPAGLLALQSPDLLVNVLNSRGPDEMRIHVPQRARECGCWVVASNTVGGPADGLPWTGGSQVFSPDGQRVALASESEPEMIVADIELSGENAATHAARGRRRPELYASLARPAPTMAEVAPRPVTVGAIQLSWYHNDTFTLKRAAAQVAFAAERGASLAVFPELFHLRSLEDVDRGALERSEVARDVVQKAAAANRIGVVATFVEEIDGALAHIAVCFGPDGDVLGTQQRTHVSANESWATPGDALATFDTPFGRVGMLIGDELDVPEVARVLALDGAELLLHPTRWTRPLDADMTAIERVVENRVHLVSAARLDSALGTGSQIVVADRWYATGPPPLPRYPTAIRGRGGFEELILATVDLADTHDKRLGAHIDVFADRIPSMYAPLATETLEP